MSANCEKLLIKVTGYDCLDIIESINSRIKNGVTPESKVQLESLKVRIEIQYHVKTRMVENGSKRKQS